MGGEGYGQSKQRSKKLNFNDVYFVYVDTFFSIIESGASYIPSGYNQLGKKVDKRLLKQVGELPVLGNILEQDLRKILAHKNISIVGTALYTNHHLFEALKGFCTGLFEGISNELVKTDKAYTVKFSKWMSDVVDGQTIDMTHSLLMFSGGMTKIYEELSGMIHYLMNLPQTYEKFKKILKDFDPTMLVKAFAHLINEILSENELRKKFLDIGKNYGENQIKSIKSEIISTPKTDQYSNKLNDFAPYQIYQAINQLGIALSYKGYNGRQAIQVPEKYIEQVIRKLQNFEISYNIGKIFFPLVIDMCLTILSLFVPPAVFTQVLKLRYFRIASDTVKKIFKPIWDIILKIRARLFKALRTRKKSKFIKYLDRRIKDSPSLKKNPELRRIIQRNFNELTDFELDFINEFMDNRGFDKVIKQALNKKNKNGMEGAQFHMKVALNEIPVNRRSTVKFEVPGGPVRQFRNHITSARDFDIIYRDIGGKQIRIETKNIKTIETLTIKSLKKKKNKLVKQWYIDYYAFIKNGKEVKWFFSGKIPKEKIY